MSSIPRGRPAMGVVCLEAARGWEQRPVSSAPGQSRRHARPSLPHVWGRQRLSLTASRGAAPMETP
jgi:hypothetical protein